MNMGFCYLAGPTFSIARRIPLANTSGPTTSPNVATQRDDRRSDGAECRQKETTSSIAPLRPAVSFPFSVRPHGLRVSVVSVIRDIFTTEAQRSLRMHREN